MYYNSIILFSIITVCNPVFGTDYDMNRVTPIELAAVGRVAALGELYDARSDRFLHLSIFKNFLPNTSIISTQNRQTKLQYTFVNTLEEKFRAMEISAGLKLSIMGGLFELEGSGKFFKDTKRSAKSAKASVVNSIKTEYEQISITDSTLDTIINLNVLEQIDATHVVVGIQWGGSVFVSVEDTNTRNEDQQKVQGNLRAQMSLLAASITGNAQVDISEKEKDALSKFNFEIYGDILPDEVPQNLIDALKFMRNVTKVLQSGNSGKGKAIKYNLIPISLLRKILKLKIMTNAIINQVDESTVQKCVKLFDDINQHDQIINDLVDFVLPYSKYVMTNKIEDLKSLQFNHQIYQSEVQKNLSDHLILVRSGNVSATKLLEIMILAVEHPNAWQNVESSVNNFSLDLSKEVNFIKMMIHKNVIILDKKQTLSSFYNQYYNNNLYILFYNDENDFGTTMTNFRNMIENKPNYGPKAVFAAVKNQLHNLPSETKLSLVNNGKVIVENYQLDSIVPADNKPDLWSLHFIQIKLKSLLEYKDSQKSEIEKDKSELISKINSVKLTSIPIGFIYTQLPNTQTPQQIWPLFEWEDVTSNYAGLFFRAEGKGSLAFGQTQSGDNSRITQIFTNNMCDIWRRRRSEQTRTLSVGSWSNNLVNDIGDCAPFELKFYVKDVETRPINTAVRIWKRAG